MRRCLEKDPGGRFESARDLGFALEAVADVVHRSRRPSRVRRPWIWASIPLAVVAGAASWLAWPGDSPRAPLRVRPITSDAGQEMDPALSPDGNQLAYVKLIDGRQDLFVKLVDGGRPLLVNRGADDAIGPAWSPDGSQIAFLRPVKSTPGEIATGVFVVPALGGAERQLATSRGRSWVGLAWSPDQNLLAVADSESPEEPGGIFLLSYDTGERRRLTRPPLDHWGDTFPRFSPDGEGLAS